MGFDLVLLTVGTGIGMAIDRAIAWNKARKQRSDTKPDDPSDEEQTPIDTPEPDS